MSETLLWADVETTGVGRGSYLLEIALLPTTFDASFAPLGDPYHAVLQTPDLSLRQVSPTVLEMHSTNGLWADSRAVGEDPGAAWSRLERRIDEWGIVDDSVYLAGRSVHFDRDFIEAYIPGQIWHRIPLSHRHFDLSSIRGFVSALGYVFEQREDAHRALDDVLADVALARELADWIGGALRIGLPPEGIQ